MSPTQGLDPSEQKVPTHDAAKQPTPDDIAVCERFLAANDIQLAKEKFETLENLAPVTENEWERLFQLAHKLGDRSRAQVYTERFLAICDDSVAAHLADAKNFLGHSRDHPRVAKAVFSALKSPRFGDEHWRDVAVIQNAIGDHPRAIDTAQRALQVDPGDIELRGTLIRSLGVLRRSDDIRKECQLLAHYLVQSKIKGPLQWAVLARTAAVAGSIKQSTGYIETALKNWHTVNLEADFEVIRAFLLTGQSRRAVKHLENLLLDNSGNVWLWTTLLNTAFSVKAYDIALPVITRLMTLPHLDPEFLYRLNKAQKTALDMQDGFLKKLFRLWRRFKFWR